MNSTDYYTSDRKKKIDGNKNAMQGRNRTLAVTFHNVEESWDSHKFSHEDTVNLLQTFHQ